MTYKLDLDSIFSFHPADTDEKRDLHERVRNSAKLLAKDWDIFVPDSPEKALAIRRLQEAMMWANSAIAQYYEHEELEP